MIRRPPRSTLFPYTTLFRSRRRARPAARRDVGGPGAVVDVRALVFDVFGTVVDWRGGVAREVRRLLGPSVDAEALADDWRARDEASMGRGRSGEVPGTPPDGLHRASQDGRASWRGRG